VFSDIVEREKLNSIVHPRVAELAKLKFKTPEACHAALRLYQVPLFFENQMHKQGFQAIVLVSAPKEVCVERIITRDGLGRAEALARIASQLPIEDKAKLSDYVLDNRGTEKELALAAQKVFAKLIS
jgi:dephospho-CoA kinase